MLSDKARNRMDLQRRAAAEFLGTGFLLAAVVGSGIMGERLSSGNAAVALLANSIATGAALTVLILTFGPISGAHLNPAVTLTAAMQTAIAWRDVPAYIAAQVSGAFAGVAAANLMFSLPIFYFDARSSRSRSVIGRVCCDFRVDRDHLVLRAVPDVGYSICSCRVYHVGVLVHILDIICESCGHSGSGRNEHIRRYTADRRSRIHHRTAYRRSRRTRILSMGWCKRQELLRTFK